MAKITTSSGVPTVQKKADLTVSSTTPTKAVVDAEPAGIQLIPGPAGSPARLDGLIPETLTVPGTPEDLYGHLWFDGADIKIKKADGSIELVTSIELVEKPTLEDPMDGTIFILGEGLITVSATSIDDDLDRIDWVLNPGDEETVIATDSSAPYSTSWNVVGDPGDYTLVARAVRGGITADSDPIDITIANPALETKMFFSGAAGLTTPANLLSPTFVRNQIRVQCWAGGAGGVPDTGGGGGGAYAETPEYAVNPSTGYNFSVAGTATTSTAGSDTSFDNGGVFAAGGHLANEVGFEGLGGQVSECVGTIRRNGGNAGLGTGNRAGGGGAGADAAGNVTAGGAPEGGFGSTLTAGRVVGAGGGSGGASGQSGQRGQLRVEYLVPSNNFARRMGTAIGRDATSVNSRAAAMPAGIVAGELLILKVAVDGGGLAFNVSVAGWDPLTVGTILDGTNAVGLAVFTKTAVGGDTATIATDVGGSPTVCQCSFECSRYADAGVPEIVTATGSSANANPPLITPSGGSGNYLYNALMALDSAPVSFGGVPASYNATAVVHPATESGVILASAHRAAGGASEDPGTFSSGNEQWVAATIAIPFFLT